MQFDLSHFLTLLSGFSYSNASEESSPTWCLSPLLIYTILDSWNVITMTFLSFFLKIDCSCSPKDMVSLISVKITIPWGSSLTFSPISLLKFLSLIVNLGSTYVGSFPQTSKKTQVLIKGEERWGEFGEIPSQPTWQSLETPWVAMTGGRNREMVTMHWHMVDGNQGCCWVSYNTGCCSHPCFIWTRTSTALWLWNLG